MTLLTTLQHPRYALALVDYLNTQGIPAQLRESGHTIAIFVLDDALLPQAQQELAQFLADPDHERYRQASWERDEVPADASNLSRVYRAPSLLQNIRQTGIVTKTVFVLCVLVYLYTGEGMNEATRAQLLFFPDLAAAYPHRRQGTASRRCQTQRGGNAMALSEYGDLRNECSRLSPEFIAVMNERLRRIRRYQNCGALSLHFGSTELLCVAL